MKVPLTIHVHEDLKKVLFDQAEVEHVTANELAARLLAKGLKRPDLGFIPRKRRGPAPQPVAV